MNGIEVRAASALAVVYVLRMLGLFMVMPVLAISAQSYPDYSPLYVGLAIGGYGLTQALLQIPMGMLSDRWGRKPVILLGLVVFSLGSFVAAYADSMSMMICGRILQGAGAIAGAIMALASDVSRETQRAKVMAIIGIAIGFSFYLAVLVGPLLASSLGLSGIFSVTGILALCCLPLVKWGVPNPVNQLASGDMLPQRSQLKSLVFSSQLWRLNVSVMILHLYITLLFVQLPTTLLAFDMTLDSQWHLYLPTLVLSVVGMAVLMRMSPGKTPTKTLMVSVALMAISFGVMLVFAQQWWWVFVAVTVFFIGFNYLEANFPALVSSIAPAGEKGTAMGIYASFQFFGAFLGGLLSGVISDSYSPSLVYVVGIVGALLWLWLLAGLKPVDKVKRVMLHGDFSQDNSVVVKQSLEQLPGVVETTVASQDQVVYLKVTAEFDINQAQLVVNAQESI